MQYHLCFTVISAIIEMGFIFSALTKKKSEDALFSDDDDFLGGLGIEEKGAAPKPKAKLPDDDEDGRPAKSAMDKLLGKSSVAKHLEPTKERREFVLDAKYTQPQGKIRSFYVTYMYIVIFI
jgi:hypothetical protein